MEPFGWFLLVIALIAICAVGTRKTSAQQQTAGIGPNEESNIYRSRSYYPSSVTSDVLTDELVGGTASSMRAPNGNGSANCSATTASSPDSTSSSDDACTDDDSSSSSDSSSSCDSGSSFDSSSSDSGSSFDSGSSSDSGSSDS
jgi:hypothetical protein